MNNIRDLSQYQRSNEPIFWGLFGFGGMVIAFAFPALVGTMIYVGLTGDASSFQISNVLHTWWGAAATFLIVFGTSFHCMHRIFFSLHDLKFHPSKAGKAICYGIATILSLAAACGLAMGL